MRMGLLARASLALSLSLSSTAYATNSACACGGASPSEAFDLAAAVFIARVLDVQIISASAKPTVLRSGGDYSGSGTFLGTSVHLETTRTFKGAPPKRFTVSNRTTSCDFSFKKGERWIFYASDSAGTLAPNKCLRTRLLAGAKADLQSIEALRKGRPVAYLVVTAGVDMDLTRRKHLFRAGGRVILERSGKRMVLVPNEFGVVEAIIDPGEYTAVVIDEDRLRGPALEFRAAAGGHMRLNLFATPAGKLQQ